MSEKNLATIAKREGIDRWLIKGPSLKEEQISDRAYSDELCAIIGALFLDSGYEDASLLATYLIDRYSDELESFVNFKSELQELVAKISGRAAESIQYVATDYNTTGGSTSFTSSLVILGQEICEGIGQSKKQSEVAAARNALTVAKKRLLSVLGSK